MNKKYTSLGLMSGTSGDGVDASVVNSDGENSYNVIFNEYFQYSNEIYDEVHSLKAKILNKLDLKKNSIAINILEKKITLFHAKSISRICKNFNIDIIGFHGQTIYHNSVEKISKQIGNADLLSQLCKKNVIYNFRNNDLQNGGQGAPLAPLYHKMIAKQKKMDTPVCFLNIGGISNITIITNYKQNNFFSCDIGPGNCLIDEWIRKQNKEKFDRDGSLASTGSVNKIILEQGQELFSSVNESKKSSLDVKDFDVSFVRGLSLEDGAATLTYLTAKIISSSLNSYLIEHKKQIIHILICGGGRKNKELIAMIKKNSSENLKFQNIDIHGVDGDFIESQAFAFLAIRSLLNLPISFPSSTGCKKPCNGGELIKY